MSASPDTARFPKLPFAVLATAFGIAGLTGIGLAFDGSSIWFLAVETGSPIVPHDRWINAALQAGPILASRYLSDPQAVSALFSLSYLLPPLLGCLCSWLVIRRRAPGLLVWSVGGVLLAPLPSQIDVVAEANIVLQLAWPLLMIVLLGVRWRDLPFIALLVTAAILSHPTSVVVLGVGAALSAGAAVVKRAQRLPSAVMAAALLAAGIGNYLWLAPRLDDYEAQLLNAGTLLDRLVAGLAGEPLIFVLAAWAALGVVLWGTIRHPARVTQREGQIPAALLILGGLALCLRAAFPTRWAIAIESHFGSLVVALPLAGAAAVDSYLAHRREDRLVALTPNRRLVASAAMLVAAAVMAAHAASWQLFADRLRRSLAAAPAACLSLAETPELAWGKGTVLEFWSVTSLSLWVQSPPPTKLIAFGPPCAGQSFQGDFQLNPWTRYPYGHRWFDLRRLGALLQTH